MDADLERVARGLGVSRRRPPRRRPPCSPARERRSAATAATMIRGAQTGQTRYQPGRYYDYDEGRPVVARCWPWLLGAGLLARRDRRRLLRLRPDPGPARRGRSPSSCRTSAGSEELNAVRADARDRARARRPPPADADTPDGIVFEQDPRPGEQGRPGNVVTICVSTGKPKTRVPNVVGRRRPRRCGAERREAALERRRRLLGEAVGHGHRAGAQGRPAPGRRLDRPDQRLHAARSRCRCRR